MTKDILESDGKKQETVESYSIFKEFWEFLKHSKKWWLLPIIIIMALLTLFIVLTGENAIFPMIYAIF